ncbi:multidrug effflux MFS transporter [Cellulomonas cellasea]|uniref:multidrug effflux MFS transporter n=1 Tax=Cellulomonas cellasea TaxID=43670 RepID=UPI0025A3341F|nr:multidrug effflux MFS transporter [Cellulomonas cellasea]MDM8085255.1 multidrug effflux MFS transporter [Cellulomonas cellasea]
MDLPRAQAATPARAHISVGLVLLLSALTAIGPFTFDTYLAAFPEIAADLGATSSAVQLTLTASLAGLAAGQLLIGSLSDAFGRRRPLIAALALYTVTSAAMLLVQTIEVFTALRVVQGFTAAAGMVLSMAMVRDRFSGDAVSKVMARLMLVVGVAPVLAPTIGAQLLRFGSWRLIFGFLAAVGVALLMLAVTTLRETLPVERRRTGGTVSALRSYRELLTDRGFLGLALLSAFYLSAMFTYVSSSTFVFQAGYGLTAQEFGWVFAGGAVSITAGTQIAGALVGRFRPQQILAGGMVAGVAVSLVLVAVAAAGAPFWPLTLLMMLTLGTAGLVMPSAPAIALEANPHRAGSAAALLGALQFGLGAVIAPLTGLGGPPSALVMAAFMSGSILVSALLLLALRRTWRRDRIAVLAHETTPAAGRPAVGAPLATD